MALDSRGYQKFERKSQFPRSRNC